jgi:hypothetical protein
MNANNENTYRQAYIDGVWDMLKFARQCSTHASWLELLHSWGASDDIAAPPNSDGSLGLAGIWSTDQTWQRAHCRGYSQGVKAAFEAVEPNLGALDRTRLQQWRDSVLKWRNKNSSRTRSGLPSPPAPPAAPHIVNS